MTTGWTPETGCVGKYTYLSKRDAKRMSRGVNTKNRAHGNPETHIYRCPGCGAYHVGRPIGTRSGAVE